MDWSPIQTTKQVESLELKQADRHPHARRRSWQVGHRGQLATLLVPALAGLGLLVLLPALLSLGLAFTEFNALTPPKWRGLQNFGDLFADPLFWTAVRNSLFFIAVAVPLRVVGALGLALLLQRRRRGIRALRTAVYLPTIIPDIAYALIWLWVLNPVFGPLNILLGALGLPAPAWLTEGHTARLAFVMMALFQIGEGFVVLLAGLKDIPDEYYQSAAVDGARGGQLFRMITLPLLSPWLVLLTLRDLMLCLQNTFTPAMVMTRGGPYYDTWFLPQMIYQVAFDRFRYGLGAALMVLFFLGLGLVLLLVYYTVRGWGYDDAI